jgi:hypothetical protein
VHVSCCAWTACTAATDPAATGPGGSTDSERSMEVACFCSSSRIDMSDPVNVASASSTRLVDIVENARETIIKRLIDCLLASSHQRSNIQATLYQIRLADICCIEFYQILYIIADNSYDGQNGRIGRSSFSSTQQSHTHKRVKTSSSLYTIAKERQDTTRHNRTRHNKAEAQQPDSQSVSVNNYGIFFK